MFTTNYNKICSYTTFTVAYRHRAFSLSPHCKEWTQTQRSGHSAQTPGGQAHTDRKRWRAQLERVHGSKMNCFRGIKRCVLT
ncbi:hypothetical protein BDR03DRAFT_950503 [Suillus americanus]|nr:hypothetical protein BDR03DRAFT_950503 [Suillus americanus]